MLSTWQRSGTVAIIAVMLIQFAAPLVIHFHHAWQWYVSVHYYEENAAIAFRFKNEDVVWVKQGKEFKHNESFYDVVSITPSPHTGVLIIKAVHDKKEKQLKQALGKLITDHKQRQVANILMMQWLNPAHCCAGLTFNLVLYSLQSSPLPPGREAIAKGFAGVLYKPPRWS